MDYSEATVHSHPFLKISPEVTVDRVILLVKLETDCSEWQLYTKMTPPRMFSSKFFAWTVQKQLSTPIHFRKFLQKIPVVEFFFWSNYRLTVQSGDYILKLLHQVQKQPFIGIHYQKLLQKTSVVESFFWSKYRLVVQSSDYILKRLN